MTRTDGATPDAATTPSTTTASCWLVDEKQSGDGCCMLSDKVICTMSLSRRSYYYYNTE
jgi:hypothetical protein